MHLDSIEVKRYRSIENAKLTSCGEFNVLIGKNNSGKSNVLSALNSFFLCLSDNVVTLDSPVAQEIDFYQKDLNQTMELAALLSLSLAERDELIRDIVVEAPQMKNAVDGLDPTLKLSIVVSITPPPESFAYVSRIALVSVDHGGGVRSVPPDRVLFEVSRDAAKELYDSLNQTRKQLEEAEILASPEIDRLSKQVFTTRSEGEGRLPLRYLLDVLPVRSGIKPSPSFVRELEGLLEKSSSYEEFSGAIQNHQYLRQLRASRTRNWLMNSAEFGDLVESSLN